MTCVTCKNRGDKELITENCFVPLVFKFEVFNVTAACPCMIKELGREHTCIPGKIFVSVLVGMIKMCLEENGDSINQ